MVAYDFIDIFNGDADGIFSLIQWRKVHPVACENQMLITGVKRDISLVQQVDLDLAQNAEITVLDISFDKNDTAINAVLDVCTKVFYCDHHKADKLFNHPKLQTRINTEPTVCTGLLINAELKDAYSLWAIAAAYGDGLDKIADRHVKRLGLSESEQKLLKELGVLVNYNGYGSVIEDLHFEPAKLYMSLLPYDSPIEVCNDKSSPFSVLQSGYAEDIELANQASRQDFESLIIAFLDDAMWARRISGTFGNQLAGDNPEKAIIIVTHNAQGSLTISLRAPKSRPYGASTLCSQYSTGGGREGAAGINELTETELDDFIKSVRAYYA